MTDPVRVTHTGTDILVPEGSYALLDDHARLSLELDEIATRAREHGAVAFEVFEGDEWQPAVIAHVTTTRSKLEVHGAFREYVFTNSARPFVMLVPDHWAEATIDIPHPGFLVRVDGAWECATWRLTPAPLPDLRDWSWRWSRSWTDFGILKLGVQRTAEELAAFVASPLYERVTPNHYRVPIEEGERRGIHEITLDHGSLWLWRAGSRDPHREVAAFETELLARILQGELGELCWDLYDTDYGVICATGDDLASLAEYLAPHCDVQKIIDHNKLVMRRHEIDASEAATREEVLAIAERELAMFPVAPRNIVVRVRGSLVGDMRWLQPIEHPRRIVSVQQVKG